MDLNQYGIQELNQQQRTYNKTCDECSIAFNTALEQAIHCGNCNTVAQVLYVHYMVLFQKYKFYAAEPNKIVERVFNAQYKPVRRLLSGQQS